MRHGKREPRRPDAGHVLFAANQRGTFIIEAPASFPGPVPSDSRTPCPACGSPNDQAASECSECGLTLRAPGATPEVESLLKHFAQAPDTKRKAGAGESLDLDKEIVDELLDSLAVEEQEHFECPLCGTAVAVDAKACPKCRAVFEEAGKATAEAAVEPAPEVAAAKREGISVRVTESPGRRRFAIGGRLMDLLILGTIAALVAVFLSLNMYSSTAIARNPMSLAIFGGVAAGGFAVGLLLFQVSTGAIAQGDRLVKSGRYEEAIRLYDRAIRTGYRPANALTSKGVALKRLGRVEDAMRCQRTALKLDPDNEIAWCNLGDLFFHQGKLDDAVGCYGKAIAARPRYAIAWNNKGAALARAGRLQEAQECHDRAVALQPRYVAAWLNRGEVLVRLGMVDEARRCLERARALRA